MNIPTLFAMVMDAGIVDDTLRCVATKSRGIVVEK